MVIYPFVFLLLKLYLKLIPKNKIVFFEDVNEKAYKIDRMLTQLSQSGILSNIKACIFADFIHKNIKEKIIINKVLIKFAKEQNFFVANGLKTGHGNIQHSIPCGLKSKIIKSKSRHLIEIDFT